MPQSLGIVLAPRGACIQSSGSVTESHTMTAANSFSPSTIHSKTIHSRSSMRSRIVTHAGLAWRYAIAADIVLHTASLACTKLTPASVSDS